MAELPDVKKVITLDVKYDPLDVNVAMNNLEINSTKR
jgi:hypothetical protein